MKFVVCVNKASFSGLSGEDHLFPVSLFLPITLSHEVAVAVHRLAV